MNSQSTPTDLKNLTDSDRRKIRLQRFQINSTEINTLDALKVAYKSKIL